MYALFKEHRGTTQLSSLIKLAACQYLNIEQLIKLNSSNEASADDRNEVLQRIHILNKSIQTLENGLQKNHVAEYNDFQKWLKEHGDPVLFRQYSFIAPGP